MGCHGGHLETCILSCRNHPRLNKKGRHRQVNVSNTAKLYCRHAVNPGANHKHRPFVREKQKVQIWKHRVRRIFGCFRDLYQFLWSLASAVSGCLTVKFYTAACLFVILSFVHCIALKFDGRVLFLRLHRPYSAPDEPTTVVSKYQLAARYGRQEDADCSRQYDGCIVSPLEIIQTVVTYFLR